MECEAKVALAVQTAVPAAVQAAVQAALHGEVVLAVQSAVHAVVQSQLPQAVGLAVSTAIEASNLQELRKSIDAQSSTSACSSAMQPPSPVVAERRRRPGSRKGKSHPGREVCWRSPDSAIAATTTPATSATADASAVPAAAVQPSTVAAPVSNNPDAIPSATPVATPAAARRGHGLSGPGWTALAEAMEGAPPATTAPNGGGATALQAPCGASSAAKLLEDMEC